MGPIQNSSVRARLRLQSTASLVQSLKKTIHPNLKNAELRLVKVNLAPPFTFRCYFFLFFSFFLCLFYFFCLLLLFMQ